MVEPVLPALPLEGPYRAALGARGGTRSGKTLCPECGVFVTKLRNHLRHAHGHNSVQGVKGNVGAGETATAVVGDSVSNSPSFNARPKASLEKSKMRALEMCPVCGVGVKSLRRHFKKTGHSPGSILSSEVRPQTKDRTSALAVGLAKCPRCHAIFPNETQLASHALGSHGRGLFTQLNFRPPHLHRQGVVPKGDEQRARDRGNPDREPTLDAKKHWGNSFRDHGQFGSHPSHDDMDDESSA